MRSWIVVAAICCIGWACEAEEFEILAVERDGMILWQAVEGHVYSVESRDDPTAPWEAVAPADQWPINAPEWLVNAGAGWPAVAQRFYRVAAEPATSGADTYLVVDISDGPDASSYPVGYLDTVPSGGWTDEYKTTNLVLRRIPAGTFVMGSPTDELGRQSGEIEHEVTLTQDFYIGVFEVTQKQWALVMGTWPSYFDNVSHRDARPVERVSYDMIRGAGAGSGWPENNDVDADSFMGRLRARTGQAFDLPTESQWEYACRAGTTTALNSGKNLTSIDECSNVVEVGRYYHNGGSGFTQDGDTSVATAKVGSYLANAWGLHDMHGNVWEWCLDWHGTYPGTVTDPKGATTGSYRLNRGGSWNYNARRCRSAYRFAEMPGRAGIYYLGFRAAVTPDH